MIRLRLKPDRDEAHRVGSVPDDVERWVQALLLRGFEVPSEDVYAAWWRHSEASCAGWLAPYGDNENDCRALLEHLEPVHLA